MDENPYRSPLAAGTRIHQKVPGWKLVLIGSIVLAPVSWLLGRGLIPPDDEALMFSLGAWPVLALVWGLLVAMRRPIFPERPKDG
jgi:hypothetical protein